MGKEIEMVEKPQSKSLTEQISTLEQTGRLVRAKYGRRFFMQADPLPEETKQMHQLPPELNIYVSPRRESDGSVALVSGGIKYRLLTLSEDDVATVKALGGRELYIAVGLDGEPQRKDAYREVPAHVLAIHGLEELYTSQSKGLRPFDKVLIQGTVKKYVSDSKNFFSDNAFITVALPTGEDISLQMRHGYVRLGEPEGVFAYYDPPDPLEGELVQLSATVSDKKSKYPFSAYKGGNHLLKASAERISHYEQQRESISSALEKLAQEQNPQQARRLVLEFLRQQTSSIRIEYLFTPQEKKHLCTLIDEKLPHTKDWPIFLFTEYGTERKHFVDGFDRSLDRKLFFAKDLEDDFGFDLSSLTRDQFFIFSKLIAQGIYLPQTKTGLEDVIQLRGRLPSEQHQLLDELAIRSLYPQILAEKKQKRVFGLFSKPSFSEYEEVFDEPYWKRRVLRLLPQLPDNLQEKILHFLSSHSFTEDDKVSEGYVRRKLFINALYNLSDSHQNLLQVVEQVPLKGHPGAELTSSIRDVIAVQIEDAIYHNDEEILAVYRAAPSAMRKIGIDVAGMEERHRWRPVKDLVPVTTSKELALYHAPIA